MIDSPSDVRVHPTIYNQIILNTLETPEPWTLWPNLELLSQQWKYGRFILKAVTGSRLSLSAQHCRCRRSGSGDFGSARRNSTGLYGGEPFCIFYLFLGTGCMIKLQSSMSKHIPVSNVFSVAAILCPLSFPSGLCCEKEKSGRYRYQLAFTSLRWKSRPCWSRSRFNSSVSLTVNSKSHPAVTHKKTACDLKA